jgi:hypothetical protein
MTHESSFIFLGMQVDWIISLTDLCWALQAFFILNSMLWFREDIYRSISDLTQLAKLIQEINYILTSILIYKNAFGAVVIPNLMEKKWVRFEVRNIYVFSLLLDSETWHPTHNNEFLYHARTSWSWYDSGSDIVILDILVGVCKLNRRVTTLFGVILPARALPRT